LIIEYTITSQDMRNCGATQQIRYDCLFRYGIESEEASDDVEAKARAKKYQCWSRIGDSIGEEAVS
jgi:hypothetical protein